MLSCLQGIQGTDGIAGETKLASLIRKKNI